MKYFLNEEEYDPKIPILRGDQDDMVTELVKQKMKEAEKKRLSAAYGGSWGDGGCSRTLDALRLFAYGWNHEVPPEWESIIKQKENERDPEYEKFLELKKKRFEG